MADAEANISINVDASRAIGTLKALQAQLSSLYSGMAKGGAQAQAQVGQLSQNLVNSINAGGKFAASFTNLSSTTDSFTNALEKNKFSMREYFRFTGAATKTFGKSFSAEFATIDKVARERVKTLQTQYIKLGRDASGAMKGIAIRPMSLDMNNLGTQVMMTAQKQQIFNKLIQQGSTNLLNFGKNTQWAGRQLMVGFTIPLTIMGGIAIKEFQKIEEQVVKFRRVYGDMLNTTADTEIALKNVRALADEFTKYGIAVEKTIELAAKVAQMGNVGAALEAQVTQATRLSVLGGMEQMEALDTTISLTNAFGVSIEDLESKINFLNAAENQTVLSIEDFNTAIPLAGSVVRQLGGDVEDLAFFLTAMREGGINASQAGNALKSSLGRLIAPSRNARDTLSGFGINVLGIVEANAGNLKGTIKALSVELDKLDPLSKARSIEALFGKFQFARMSTLFQNISKDGSQANKVLALTTSTTAELGILAERELRRVEESPAFKLQKQMEQLRASLAPIGAEFVKLITPIVEFGTKILQSFNGLSDGTKKFVTGFVAIAGIIAPAFLMGLGLVANGIANFSKGIQKVFQFLSILSGTSKMLGGSMSYQSQQMLESGAIASSLSQDHQRLSQVLTAEATALNMLSGSYNQAAIAARGFAAVNIRPDVVVTGPAAVAPSRYNPFMPPKKYAKGKLVPGYSDGVFMVPGRTSDGDAQPAMLTAGEAVISEPMTRKYGPLINAMIADNIPGYATSKKANISNTSELAVHLSAEGAKPQKMASIEKILNEQVESISRNFGIPIGDAAKRVIESFKELEKGSITTADALKKTEEYKEIRKDVLSQKTEELHLDPGQTRKAGAIAGSMGTSAGGKLVDLWGDVDPNKNIQLKTGWTRKGSAYANRALSAESSAYGMPAQEGLDEYQGQGGVEKWEKGLAKGGYKLSSDPADPIRQSFESFDRKLVELQQKAIDNKVKFFADTEADIDGFIEKAVTRGEIKETDDDAKKALRAKYRSYEKMEEEASQVLTPEAAQIRDTARNQAFSTRIPITSPERANLQALVEEGGPKAASAEELLDIYETSDKRERKFSPKGVPVPEEIMPEAAADISANIDKVVDEVKSKMVELGQASGEGIIQGTETSLEIASPSKRMFSLGKNAGDSLADGFDSSRAGKDGAELPPRPPARPGSNLDPPLPPGMPPPPQVEQPGSGGRFARVKDAVGSVAKKAGQKALEKPAIFLARAAGNQLTDDDGNVVYDPDTDPKFLAQEEARRQASIVPPGVVAARVAASRTAQARSQYIADQGLANYDDASGMFTATPAGRAQGLKSEFSVLTDDIFESAEAAGRASQELRELAGAADEAARSVDQAEGNVSADGVAIEDGSNAGDGIPEGMKMLPNGQIVTEKEYDKIVKKADRAQRRQRRASVALRGLGTASMITGIATQLNFDVLGFNVAETAQKFLPLIGGLTAVLPILLALPGPLALIVAVIGAGIWAWTAYNKMLSDARKRGYEFAEALGTGKEAMQKFADFAGTVGSQEKVSAQAANIGIPLQTQPGKTTFGEAFVQSEDGQKFVSQIKTGLSTLGNEAAATMLTQQLSLAVADKTLTLIQARSIAAALSKELGNYQFGINVDAKLLELVGPGSEDLLKDPLQVSALVGRIADSGASIIDDTLANAITKYDFDSPEVIDKYVEEEMTKRQEKGPDFYSKARQQSKLFGLDFGMLLDNTLTPVVSAIEGAAELLGKDIPNIGREIGQFLQGSAKEAGEEGFVDEIMAKLRSGITEFNEEDQERMRQISGFTIDQIIKSLNDLESEVSLELQAAALRFDVSRTPSKKRIDLSLLAQKLDAEQIGQNVAVMQAWLNVYQVGVASQLEAANALIEEAKRSGDENKISEAYKERNKLLVNIEKRAVENLKKIYGGYKTVTLTGSRRPGGEDATFTRKDLFQPGLIKDIEVKDRESIFKDQNARILEGIEDAVTKSITTIVLNSILGAYETEEEFSANMQIRAIMEDGDISAYDLQSLLSGIEDPQKKTEIKLSLVMVATRVGREYAGALARMASSIESPEIRSKFLIDVGNTEVPPGDLASYVEGLGLIVNMQTTLGEAFESVLGEYVKNPPKLKVLVEMMSEADRLQGDYSKQNLIDVLGEDEGTKVYQSIELNREEFDALEEDAKKSFITQVRVIFANSSDPVLIALLRSQFPGSVTQKFDPFGNLLSTTIDPKAAGGLPLPKLKDGNKDIEFNPENQNNNNNNNKGGGDSGSILDPIVKASRDFGNAAQELTTGWEASLQAILDMADGVAWATNGLARQLRSASVPETMIEKFLGMPPEEWEKAKRDLFEVNADGTLGELNERGKKVMEAYVSAGLAEATNQRESETRATEYQVQAYKDLRAAGLSASEALEISKDKNLAEKIATSENTEEKKKLIAAQKELTAVTEEYAEISEEVRISNAIRDMNKDFAERIKLVQKLTKEQKKLSDAQISAILENKDLGKLFLKPGIDPKALQQALADANRKAQLELDIKKLTFSGQEGLFREGMSAISSSFSAMEQKITLEVNAKLKSDSDLVKSAQEELALIQFELGNYQAALDEIGREEERINKSYDKRLEALDRIAELNQQIEQSQKSQLDLADALSKGDIAAAAKAAQEMRSEQQRSAIETQRQMLETARETENKRIVSSMGLNREQVEDMMRDLEKSMFDIEQKSIRPAEERIRLAELERDRRIEQLRVLGKTKEEWDRVQNRVDLAAASGWRFADAIREAVNIIEKLINSLSVRDFVPNEKTKKKSGGGMMNYAMGGQAKGYRMGGLIPYKSNGGFIKGYRMGGLIPYKSEGGFFSSLGSDTIPAMLTPGEFVVRRPAVSDFGAENLEKINRGTYESGSMYNYNLEVNVKSESSPEAIAQTVMAGIKQIEGRRIRGNNYNG
jgi:TP901 family phage tail tape measure protein